MALLRGTPLHRPAPHQHREAAAAVSVRHTQTCVALTARIRRTRRIRRIRRIGRIRRIMALGALDGSLQARHRRRRLQAHAGLAPRTATVNIPHDDPISQ